MTSKNILFAFFAILISTSAFSSALTDSLPEAPDTLSPLVYDDRVFNESIHTVQLHPTGNPMGMPLLYLKSAGSLQLSFDELDADFKDYRFTLVHCDANWQPSGLQPDEYLDGFTEDEIKDVRSSFSTRQAYMHYSMVVPNENMQIKLPGNYIVKVYENDSINSPVLTARMMVADQQVTVTGNAHQATSIEEKKYKQEVDFSITHDQYPIENPFTDLKVCIIQNRRKDNGICSLKPRYIRDRLLDYDYDSENVFDGGSEFRKFDARTGRNPGERITSLGQDFEGIHLYVEKDLKRSYLRYTYDPDLDGGYRIKTYDGHNDSLEADYVWVHLTLSSDETFSEGGVYVMGDFCHWNFDTTNKMVYNLEDKAYHAKLYLKQGYYNYCYLYKTDGLAKGETSVVEGDHYETENNYLVLVYYRAPGTRYDSLISATVMNSLNKN